MKHFHYEANFPSLPLPHSLTHSLTHLCLGIWPDPGQSSIPAVHGELLVQFVSQHDGQWHHLLRLISGIAIHETLCVWKGGERGRGEVVRCNRYTHIHSHTIHTLTHTLTYTHTHTLHIPSPGLQPPHHPPPCPRGLRELFLKIVSQLLSEYCKSCSRTLSVCV